MKTLKSFRNTAWLLCSALVISLAGCGGGGGANPADPVVEPPVVAQPVVVPPAVVPPVVNVNPPNPGSGVTLTVAFITPGADAAIPSDFNARVDVTGSPDKVEFYVNGVLKGVMNSPSTPVGPEYYFYWTASSEPEGTYILTAKATKAGSSDVTSAPRTILVDRTFPTLVSRTPLDAAKNVLPTDEISITMSEPMLASSIDFNTVKLLKNGVDVDSIATLDSTGKKISVRFKNSQLYPATLTMVVNGIKDLAGKGAMIPDATFGVVNIIPNGLTPTVVLSFLTDTGTDTITKASRGKTLGSHMAYAQVAWADFPANVNVRFSELLVGDKIAGLGSQINASQDADNCTLNGYCTRFNMSFSWKSNGTLPMKARLTLTDGSVIESAVKPLTVARVNAANDGAVFPSGWTRYTQGFLEGYSSSDIGTIESIGTPSIYQVFAANPTYYSPSYGSFYRHNTGANVNGGIVEYSRNFPVNGVFGIDDEYRPGFGALYFNPNSSSADKISVRVRSCTAAGPVLGTCSVYNSSIGIANPPNGTGGVGSGPPWIPNISYIQVVLRFDTSFKATSEAAIGDLFFGY